MKAIKISAIALSAILSACIFSSCDTDPVLLPDESNVPVYANASEDLYAATLNSIVATDALGRSFGESNLSEQNKKVGIFYFVWHGEHVGSGIYNVEELKETNPDALWSVGNDGTPIGSYYYWAEPLYGYYRSDDPWVIERHLELFTMSGLDYIALDLTNISVYERNCTVLFDKIVELQEQGWPVPKVMAFLNGTDSNIDHAERILRFYKTFCTEEKYDGIWYRSPEDDKPVISIDVDEYYRRLEPEVWDYFHFRNTVWPAEENPSDAFEDMSWMDYVYPQRLYESVNGGIMNVSVAQHTAGSFGLSANPRSKDAWYNSNRGRGYDYATGQNSADNINAGTNLETQWSNALNEINCDEVFVTGWNEWIAEKRPQDRLPIYYAGEQPLSSSELAAIASFCDNCDLEFSRDIEMMSGGYGDNYYLQNARNVRAFKSGKEFIYYGAHAAQDIQGSAWDHARTYLDFSGDAMARNAQNAAGTATYLNETNRNDIIQTEISHDGEYLYVRVITKDDIRIDAGEENNLNILLSVSGTTGAKWNGYNFVLNRNLSALDQATTKLQRVAEDGKYSFTDVADCDMYVSGRVFSARIRLSDLGIADSRNFTVDFKVADGISDPSDIMKYYIDGDSAPIGRLNYRYNSVTAESSR